MAEMQGKDVKVEISTDLVTPVWKTLICEVSNGVRLSRETTSTQTKCDNGTAKIGLGALSWSFEFEAVADTIPTASQVTYADFLGYIVNGTKVLGRVLYTGEFHHQGQVYVTDLSLDSADGDVVRFSGTLSGTGAIAIA